MATQVVNPTNAPTKKGAAIPFIRKENQNKIVATNVTKKDPFNSGKDYPDEGAPLLTQNADFNSDTKPPVKPYATMTHPLIAAPTAAEMAALSQPDESSQTQVKYLREAVVMDVDAKLIVSTETQMRNGHFREAHYPTLLDYMKSGHYKRLREARIIASRMAGVAQSTRFRESEDNSTPLGIQYNPSLVRAFRAADARIEKRLREGGAFKELDRFNKENKRLREDAFTQDTSFGQPNWDGGVSASLAGREPDFIPLMAGPYNKQLYWFDYLDMHSKAFNAWTHNPIAKRIVKVITQFVLGKGVKLTVMNAQRREELEQQKRTAPAGSDMIQMAKMAQTGQTSQVNDYKPTCQNILDRHWKKNKLHIRSKQILRSLLIFGEQFIRYFDAPWGLKMRQIDPSVVWEIITDPDDVENEFYLHCQYPTQYQWFVDLPVPTIKFIIRQVPSALYYHMKINTVEGEKRGRSELFTILGWLKRLKEYASDRVIRNKMANLFVLDVAVEGDASTVEQVRTQFQTPPTPGSFFIHNKAAELDGVNCQVGASETAGDWEMLLTIIAMGAGISKQYLGMGEGQGGKAGAMIGTEPDIKTFEDYQEMMEDFMLEDAARVFERAKERNEIPRDMTVTVEATYPALAEENRSEKLKDLAFMESMSWVSHRRVSSAAAKEMQMTSYDYDQEQWSIAQEDATKEFLINTAYQQVTKGVDSAQQSAAGGGSGTSSGSSGKGASGMGMGKALPTSSSSSTKASIGEAERSDGRKFGRDLYLHEADFVEDEDESEEDEAYEDETTPATSPGSSTASSISGRVGTLNASKREAENIRYQQRKIGRKQDRIQTPDKIRDQKSLDRGQILSDARRAMKSGNLNKEARHYVGPPVKRFPRLAN